MESLGLFLAGSGAVGKNVTVRPDLLDDGTVVADTGDVPE